MSSNRNGANDMWYTMNPSEDDCREVKHHDMPVSVGLSVAFSVTPRLTLSSGLVYTLATSTFRHGTAALKDEQTLHYIGIPLNAACTLWGNNRVRTYVTAGAQADVNVKARLKTEGYTTGMDNDRVQFSLAGGFGVQLNVTPRIGIYAEPGVRYYFDNGSAVQTLFKEHPTRFNLQVGLRYTVR